MYRVLLAAAATVALSMSAQAGGYDDGYASESRYRQHARHTHRSHTLRGHSHYGRGPKPYHVGAAGLIVVDEPYGERMYEHAVRTRDRILWGR